MTSTAKETADLALEIMKDQPEQHLVQEAIQLVNRCRTTTLALKAIQQAIRETCDDVAGAALLEAIISAMAVHDAETM